MEKIEILKDLKNLLIKHFGNVIDKVILYGSQINGYSQEYSDYDILIIVNIDYDWRTKNRILSVCNDIDLKYDILTDVTIISHNELKSLSNLLATLLEISLFISINI